MPNEIYHRSEWGNPKADGFGDVYFDASATNKLYKHSDYYENSDGTDKILRDIPNKASIVLTPTAYSDGSLNTVIPPYQVLPQELVTNGTFDTDSDWTKDAGWTISNGEANCDGVGINSLQQSGITTTGKIYKLTFDIISKSNNSFLIISTNFGDTYISGSSTGLGTNTFYIQPTNGTGIRFRVANGTTLSIDNVSVKEVQEADFDFSRASVATRVNEKGLIEDVASGIPRIDYTSGQGALLLETQSTNKITYSEDFTQWTLGSNATLTYESDVVAPDGTSGVYRLQLPATGATYITSNSFTGVNPLSVSIYVKSAGQEEDDFNLYTGTTSSEKFTATSEWKRFNYTLNGASFSIINSGDTFASDIYIWGAQAEALSYATSYIPTEGSTVTRSADVANNSGNADLINSTEGVLYAEIAALANDGVARELTINDGTTNNRVIISYNNYNKIRINYRNSSSNIFDQSINSTITDFHKIAVKWKVNDFSFYLDGNQVASSSNGSVIPANTLTTLSFDDGSGNYNFKGNTKALAVFKEALTDAELESLTSWISFVEMATDLEYTIE